MTEPRGIRPDDVLADDADTATFDGVDVRKGSVAAFVANARALASLPAADPARDAARAGLRELTPAVRAVGVFDVFRPRDPEVAAVVDELADGIAGAAGGATGAVRHVGDVGDARDVRNVYARYLDCLNARDLAGLAAFVDPDVVHNGRPLGLAGYRRMIADDLAAIPDLRFVAESVLVGSDGDGALVAARLHFDCHPGGSLHGVAFDGRRAVFDEHVFYRLVGGRIAQVWSLLGDPAPGPH